MSLSSTYLRNSLPNRSPSQRPRSQSLSEYQPLSFDREALEAAYQQTLGLPSSSSISSRSIPSWSSFVVSGGGGSEDTHDTGATSMLSQDIKPGDNPHGPVAQDAPPLNHAGLGAGHSLTPPHSPFHSVGPNHNSTAISHVPGSPKFPLPPPRPKAVPRSSIPPTPPPRPTVVPGSTFDPASEPHPGIGMRRAASAMDVDEGYLTDPSVSNRARGKRRALPALPTDVPAPVSIKYYLCFLF